VRRSHTLKLALLLYYSELRDAGVYFKYKVSLFNNRALVQVVVPLHLFGYHLDLASHAAAYKMTLKSSLTYLSITQSGLTSLLEHRLIRINIKNRFITNNYNYLSHTRFYLLNILTYNTLKIHAYHLLVVI